MSNVAAGNSWVAKGRPSGRRLTRASAVARGESRHERSNCSTSCVSLSASRLSTCWRRFVALLAHGAQIALGELLHQALDLVGMQVPGEQGDALALLLVVEHAGASGARPTEERNPWANYEVKAGREGDCRPSGVGCRGRRSTMAPMPSIETLVASLACPCCWPSPLGPDNIFVLLQSAQRGWRAGVCVVWACAWAWWGTRRPWPGAGGGVCRLSMAFTVLKVVGAAYLAWLAWGALRAPASVHEAPPGGAAAAGGNGGALRMVGRGVVMNLTNPKVLVFFLAFLPQFADPAQGGMAPDHAAGPGVHAGDAAGVWRHCLLRGVWRAAATLGRAQRLLNRCGRPGVSGPGAAAGHGPALIPDLIAVQRLMDKRCSLF